MKKLLLLALLPLFAHAYSLGGKIVNISDSDTVTLLIGNTTYRIRLDGIDAPERGQPYGKKSTELLSGLIKSQSVHADCHGEDRYKRHLCTIYLDDTDVNAYMVRNGAAWVYRKYYKGTAYYALEKAAQEEGLGLWGLSEYERIAPWEWRKQQKNK